MSSKTENPESCNNVEKNPDDALVSGRPDDMGRRTGRRAFVKGIGATAALGVGSKYLGSPVGEAEAIAPLLAVGAIGLAAGAVGGIAFGATIAGPDENSVSDALDYQSHLDAVTGLRSDRLMLEETLASMERDVSLVENKAREEAIFRIYEAGVDGLSESAATTAAEAAINEAYATVERSILNSWNVRFVHAESILNMFGGSWDTSTDSALMRRTSLDESPSFGSSAAPSPDFGTVTHTLYDGSTVTYHSVLSDGFDYTHMAFDPVAWSTKRDNADATSDEYLLDRLVLGVPSASNYGSVDTDPDLSYSEVVAVDASEWASLLSDLETARSSMMSEVSAMVSSYYQPAVDGEIDLYQAIGPSHLTETASTAKDYQEAAMALRAMGYPMSKQVVTFTLPTESGEPLELTGRLSWTAHQGNTLAVGQTHFAGSIPGSIFAAVNLPDGVDSLDGNATNTTNTSDGGGTDVGPGAETIELTDEFTIVSAGGADGVSFEDRSLASSDLTNEEINQVYKENYTANKEATETVHDTATGGGGGWDPSNWSSGQIGAALVAVAVGLGLINK